ncbi:MAG: TauD/TfdA family dioxygenase [Gammaproteobacteria bacterium]|nr:TauD/TfdA family dioxygenase [Gammaproteobacteria bacterium]
MSLDCEPLSGALGATVRGIDLSEPIDASRFQQLNAALLEHGVLFFHDQQLTPAQQVAFARHFGDIHYHPHVQGLAEQPEVMEILKTETDTVNFGAGWHSDQMFLDEPAMGTCLYALEVPAAGGDTLFACMRAGYRSLSPAMQRLARGLKTVNLSVAGQQQRRGQSSVATYSSMRTRDAGADEPTAVHPLVRTHPQTGEDVLYIGIHTLTFLDHTPQESRALIDFLLDQVTRPEHTCRFRWRAGSLALWDNRRVLHNAINDYPGKRRRMHRVTVVGDRPVSVNRTAA